MHLMAFDFLQLMPLDLMHLMPVLILLSMLLSLPHLI
jgi:hypothetical protein